MDSGFGAVTVKPLTEVKSVHHGHLPASAERTVRAFWVWHWLASPETEAVPTNA